MVKKGRRKLLSEKVGAVKTKNQEPQTSRFELKFSKKKNEVSGKIKGPERCGRPVLSKTLAFEKRRQTLGHETENFGKANKFVDRRLFEKSKNLTKEEKMMKRFAVERRKRYAKDNLNLNDDDFLTHYGQNLAEIEKFDNQNRSDDEENEINLPAAANFGGDEDDQEPPAKMRKRLIDEMITKSKQIKHEKQQKREEIQNLTEKLDEQWKEILENNLLSRLMAPKNSKNDENLAELFEKIDKSEQKIDEFDQKIDKTEQKIEKSDQKIDKTDEKIDKITKTTSHVTSSQSEDYDTLFRSLCFDTKRVAAGERLKSDRELAQEEREKLGKYELERQKCMNLPQPMETGQKSLSHVNPDELETNLATCQEDKKNDVISDEEMDENVENESEFEYEFESNEKMSKNQQPKNLHKSTAEISFVFEMPENYAQFKQNLHKKSIKDQSLILERHLKCLHPSLRQGNKQKLQKLFLYLLRYFDECCKEMEKLDMELLKMMTSFLFKLKDYGIEYAGKSCRALLNKHIKTCFPENQDGNGPASNLHRKKPLGKMPAKNIFCFLRLIPHIFPTSDFFHSIVTPTFLFMSKILQQLSIDDVIYRSKSIDDVIKGLFLSTIFIEYLKKSKKFAPELINFLQNVLKSGLEDQKKGVINVSRDCSDWSEIKTVSISSIFQSKSAKNDTKNEENSSKIEENTSKIDENQSKIDKNHAKIDKILSCLWSTIEICKFLCTFWSNLPSWLEIFQPIIDIIDQLPKNRYPEKLKHQIDGFKLEFENLREKMQRQFLTYPISEKSINQPEFKFHEPKIESNFNPEVKKSKTKNKFLTEREHLKKKFKREYKSTVRELRRDNEFLARRQMELAQKKDKDRREKTKRLMSSLMGQEADYKKMKRAKPDK